MTDLIVHAHLHHQQRNYQIIECLLSISTNTHPSSENLECKKTNVEKNQVNHSNRIVFSKCEFKVQTSIQFRSLTLTGCSIVALSKRIKPFTLDAIDLTSIHSAIFEHSPKLALLSDAVILRPKL